MAKIKPVKAAVIGCGMISGIYMKNLTQIFTSVELVGCSDLFDWKAKKRAEEFSLKVMTNEEIFADPEIEMVLNLTYASAHYEVSKAALEAGKHVYSEKMMAVTMDEADELVDIAKRNNLRFAIAPDTFLGASMQTCRHIVDSGLIGEPVVGSVKIITGYHLIKSDEDDSLRRYSVVRRGGGIVYDMGGYYLHALFNMFGSIKRVCGFAGTRNANRPMLNPRHSEFGDNFFMDTPNFMVAALEFRSGLMVTLTETCDCFASDQSFEIYGTEGAVYCGDPNIFGNPVYVKRRDTEKLEYPFVSPYSGNSRGIAAAEMAWAIRQDRPQRLSTDMGYHALEVTAAVLACSQDGQTREIKTTFERPKPFDKFYTGGTSNERILSLY